MSAKPSSLCFAIFFLMAALMAAPASAGKKSKGRGGPKYAGHGHRGGRTRVAISPFGLHVGVVGNDFGFALGTPWGAPPFYADGRPLGYGPVPLGVQEPVWGPPAIARPPIFPRLAEQRWLANGAPAPTTIPTHPAAVEYQIDAERFFRGGRFDLALPAVRHAMAEDPQNGNLVLFESHIHLALGDYTAAAEALARGTRLLPRNQWGYVVQRYEHLYVGRMYVDQMRGLEAHLAEHPDDAAAHLTRGYHYCFLRSAAAARQALEEAVALDGNNQTAMALLQLAQRQSQPVAAAPIPPVAAPIEPVAAPIEPVAAPIEPVAAPIERLPTPADPLEPQPQ